MRVAPDGLRRIRPARRRYLASLLVALCILGLAFALSSAADSARGMTSQGTGFELRVIGGHVRGLSTSLSANCGGGVHWSARWAPQAGRRVRFIVAGKEFSTSQVWQGRYPGGVLGRIAFMMHGRLTGQGSALGTVRLVARFYRGEEEQAACDSLDVAWAVGPFARERLQAVTLGHQVGAYYPSVPSLARKISPKRRRFIDRADATCVRMYSKIMAGQRTVAVRYRDSPGERTAVYAAYVRGHARELRAIVALGRPPDGQKLYEAWLANFRSRVTGEAQALRLYEQSEFGAAQRKLRPLDASKTTGNLLGQRFGLILCTSNGDRTPVPILSDDPAMPLS